VTTGRCWASSRPTSPSCRPARPQGALAPLPVHPERRRARAAGGVDRLRPDAAGRAVRRGPVIRGPGGTGMYDAPGGRPGKDLVPGSRRARGTCSPGHLRQLRGVGADGDIRPPACSSTRRTRAASWRGLRLGGRCR
jgi:hypothetical protein